MILCSFMHVNFSLVTQLRAESPCHVAMYMATVPLCQNIACSVLSTLHQLLPVAHPDTHKIGEEGDALYFVYCIH